MAKQKKDVLKLCRYCGDYFFKDGGTEDKKGFLCRLCQDGHGRMGDD